MAKRSEKKKSSLRKDQTRSSPKRISSNSEVQASGLPAWLPRFLLIAGVTYWIYWPAIHGGWLWDDGMYLAQNPLMGDPARLWKLWFQPGCFIEYYPIEETLQWAQWQLWQNNTFGYHLTNVTLHLANSLLVWRLLSKFQLRSAWIGALIFAVHPINVESVAWISEFKSVLCLGPMLLAMCAWMDYEQTQKRGDYLLALGLFLVAMLCKVMVAMFPVVILLYAWWMRGRIAWRDLRVAAPFFAISLILGLVTSEAGATYLHNLGELPAAVSIGGFFPRLALSGLTLSFYFTKFFLPLDLLPIYHQWKVNPPTVWQFSPWLVLIGMVSWLWIRRDGWGRHVLLGLGFFIINLAPFLGFVAISYMSFTWVMDHFLYFPVIGLVGLVVAALDALERSQPVTSRLGRTALITLAVALLVFRSHWYTAAFADEETFWNYTLERNPEAWFAHNDLGKLLLSEGHPEEAAEHFQAAIALQPGLGELYGSLGLALVDLGKIPEGIDQLKKALTFDPNDAIAYNNLGIALAHAGQFPEAVTDFTEAIKLKPRNAEAYFNMGNAFNSMGHFPEAMGCYRQALKIRPGYAAAHYGLGQALFDLGQDLEAMKEFSEVLRSNSSSIDARRNLGLILEKMGRTPEAIEQFQAILQLDPDNADARQHLAKLQQSIFDQKPSDKN